MFLLFENKRFHRTLPFNAQPNDNIMVLSHLPHRCLVSNVSKVHQHDERCSVNFPPSTFVHKTVTQVHKLLGKALAV